MRTSIVTFAAAVALAACGGDDGGSPGAAPSGSSAPASPPVALTGIVNDHGTGDATGGTLALELDDSYFGPTYVKGTPGSTVMVSLANEGSMPHNFSVASPKLDVTVAAGGTGVASVTLPKEGAVAFYCKFHQAQGMQGAFYGKPGDKVTGGSGDDGGAYGQ